MKGRYFVFFDKILDTIGYIVLGFALSLPIFFLLCAIASFFVDDHQAWVRINISIGIITVTTMPVACLFEKTRKPILALSSHIGRWVYAGMNRISDYLDVCARYLFIVIGVILGIAVFAFLLSAFIGWVASLSLSAIILIVLLFLLLK